MRSKTKFWIFFFCLLIFGGWLGYRWLFDGLPSPDSLYQRLHQPSVRIVDRIGQLLYESIAETGGRHQVVELSSVPEHLKNATIATEDSGFYQNPGIDLRGIVRAFWINLMGQETVAGGSTITQQVARNLILSDEERVEVSLRRKLREVILAWQLSQQLSKDEILGLYLNQIYYGSMAYGVEAAAQTYFGRTVSELDLAQAALLAGLPQAPALYDPFIHADMAKKRQTTVLELMEKQNYITSEQLAQAVAEPLYYSHQPYPMEAPHFVLMVRNQVDELLNAEQIYRSGGLTIHTTLDLDWQHHAEQAITRQIDALKKSEDGLGHNVNSAAVVALNPVTGEILTLVGSPDYFDTQHAGAINMVLSARQPGSAIKPLVYAVALDPQSPDPWTAGTMVLDVRTSFTTHEGRVYVPANYDNLEHGPVSVRQSLASSLNIPAVITLDHIGLFNLFELTSRLGISTLQDPEQYDLSLALGGGEVKLLELSAAYGAFANGGNRVFPYSIQQIENIQGKILYQATPASTVRVMDPRVAWLISDILSDNEARRLGFGANSILRLDRVAAVKTGTTSNFHDNWTVGYTPDLVVGVWAGNTDFEPMRDVTGLSGAAPIWHQFMRTVLVGIPETTFKRPTGLTQVEICSLSGLLPNEVCPYRHKERFIDGTQPKKTDDIFQEVQIDRATGLLADRDTPPERIENKVALDLPIQARGWARSQGLMLVEDLTIASTNVDRTGNHDEDEPPIKIVSPAQNSIFRIARNLPRENQKIHIQILSRSQSASITLYLDGVSIANFSQAPYEIWAPLTPGTHYIWAESVLPGVGRIVSDTVTYSVQEE